MVLQWTRDQRIAGITTCFPAYACFVTEKSVREQLDQGRVRISRSNPQNPHRLDHFVELRARCNIIKETVYIRGRHDCFFYRHCITSYVIMTVLRPYIRVTWVHVESVGRRGIVYYTFPNEVGPDSKSLIGKLG